MIRLNFALHRLANLSRPEFQRYWRDRHGPLVAGEAAEHGVRALVDDGAAGERGAGVGRPAVVLKQAQLRVDKIDNTISAVKQAIDFQQTASQESLKSALLNLDVQDRNLQLALRHPDNDGPGAKAMLKLAKELQERIAPIGSPAYDIIEMGWNTEYDVKHGG